MSFAFFTAGSSISVILRLFSGGINVNNHINCLGSHYGWGLCASFPKILVGRLASPYPEASHRWTTALPEPCYSMQTT